MTWSGTLAISGGTSALSTVKVAVSDDEYPLSVNSVTVNTIVSLPIQLSCGTSVTKSSERFTDILYPSEALNN